MIEKVLYIIQGIPAAAFAAAAVLQFIMRQPRLGWINVCFALANWLIFYGGSGK